MSSPSYLYAVDSSNDSQFNEHRYIVVFPTDTHKKEFVQNEIVNNNVTNNASDNFIYIESSTYFVKRASDKRYLLYKLPEQGAKLDSLPVICGCNNNSSGGDKKREDNFTVYLFEDKDANKWRRTVTFTTAADRDNFLKKIRDNNLHNTYFDSDKIVSIKASTSTDTIKSHVTSNNGQILDKVAMLENGDFNVYLLENGSDRKWKRAVLFNNAADRDAFLKHIKDNNWEDPQVNTIRFKSIKSSISSADVDALIKQHNGTNQQGVSNFY